MQVNPITKSILIVAAHTDDEVLGCGGTIAWHVAQGHEVHVVFMADGVSSRDHEQNSGIELRNQARDQALQILRVTQFYTLNFPDNRMDSVPLLDIVQALEPIIRQVKPSRIYTHHHGDLNVDHRITYQAVLTACRPEPESIVREILSFEVMSSTEWAATRSMTFMPNAFIDITDFLKTKLLALSAYKIEMRSPPHSRSLAHIESLARHRGYSVGVDAAEGFEVVRFMMMRGD